jgi:hypothetical protein
LRFLFGAACSSSSAAGSSSAETASWLAGEMKIWALAAHAAPPELACATTSADAGVMAQN